jgi:hypothetical protein
MFMGVPDNFLSEGVEKKPIIFALKTPKNILFLTKKG